MCWSSGKYILSCSNYSICIKMTPCHNQLLLLETSELDSRWRRMMLTGRFDCRPVRGLYSSFTTALRCFPSFRFHACPETPPSDAPNLLRAARCRYPISYSRINTPPLYANSTSGNARFVCNYPVPFLLYC